MHFSSSKKSLLRFVPNSWKVCLAYWFRQAADCFDPQKTLSSHPALIVYGDDMPVWVWDDQSGGFRHATEDEKEKITSQSAEVERESDL